MHPRESIPNVGRRAQGHRAAGNLTLRGNKVHAAKAPTTTTTTTTTKTTTNTFKLLLPADSGSPRSQSEDVHLYVHVNGHGGNSVSEAHQHHHHHPYSRTMNRILHRNGVTTGQQAHTDTQSPTDQVDLSPSTNRYTMNRTSRLLANLHQGKRPRHRDSSTDKQQQQSKPHWQGSRSVRRHEKPEAARPTQSSYKPAKQSETQPTVDLSRGFLTGRNPAQYLHDELEDQRLGIRMPDTTRSEPADVSRLSKDLSKLPELLQIRNTEPLDELLDYYWVYQCMGRQVLNLDLPREVWDRKMFRKRAILPPILSSDGHKGTDMVKEDQSSAHPEHKPRVAERTFKAERFLPDVVREARSQHPQVCDVSDGFGRGGLCAADVKDNQDGDGGGVVRERHTKKGQGTRGRAGTVKLVVKMPVLTRDVTYSADLVDND